MRTTDPHGVEKLHHSAGRHPDERLNIARVRKAGQAGASDAVSGTTADRAKSDDEDDP